LFVSLSSGDYAGLDPGPAATLGNGMGERLETAPRLRTDPFDEEHLPDVDEAGARQAPAMGRGVTGADSFS
jgi:hypothetical protein